MGRKTAERIVVELKDKLDAVTVETERPAASSPAGVEADVISALTNLGYDTRTAKRPYPKQNRKRAPPISKSSSAPHFSLRAHRKDARLVHNPSRMSSSCIYAPFSVPSVLRFFFLDGRHRQTQNGPLPT